jgi:hypothetical protein
MPKFNLYTAWMDPVFYAWAAVFAAALVAMVYSIRKYVELKNASFDEDDRTGEAEAYADVPVVDGPAEEPVAEAEQPVQQELPAAAAEEAPQPDAGLPCAEESAPAEAAGSSRAETFVRGIYDGISGLDARLKSIESSLSKGRVNNDFTVKFLEDILQDIDGLDKAKIKARLEYLVSDLKK